MPVTDPIADFLTILKTNIMAHKEDTIVKRSRSNESILKILKREGFIANFRTIEDNKQGVMKVYFRYEANRTPYLTGIKRISKPGRRVYIKAKDIKSLYGGIGIAVVSTSKGLMTDKEAKENKLGGEVLCHVW